MPVSPSSVVPAQAASKQADAALWAALQASDTEAVGLALDQGANPNSVKGSRSVLEAALRLEPTNVPLVRRLLQAGASAATRPGAATRSPLLLALQKPELGDLFPQLIAAGLPADEEGMRCAVQAGSRPAVLAMAEAGAPLRGSGELMKSWEYRNEGSVPLLLGWPFAAGAPPLELFVPLLQSLTAKECQQVGEHAIGLRSTDSTYWRALLAPSVLNRYAAVLAGVAAAAANIDALEDVLALAPDAPQQEFTQATGWPGSVVAILARLCLSGRTEWRAKGVARPQRLALLDRVLELGFSPCHPVRVDDKQSHYTVPPLNHALSFGDGSERVERRVFDALVKAGSDPKQIGVFGNEKGTLLHEALVHNRFKLVAHLLTLQSGAEWDTTEYGVIAFALDGGRRRSHPVERLASFLPVLLAHGVPPSRPIYRGITPLHALALNYGPRRNQRPSIDPGAGRTMALALMDAGADPLAPDHSGHSALFYLDGIEPEEAEAWRTHYARLEAQKMETLPAGKSERARARL